MKKYSGDWVVPVTKDPVFRGVLILNDNGTIIEILDPDKVDVELTEVQHFNGILCPGFVNTHCHLELSYLQGKLERRGGLDRFIRNIRALHKQELPNVAADQEFYMQSAEKEMIDTGTLAVGDVVGHSPSVEHQRIKETSSLYFHNFVEVYGSDPSSAINRFTDGINSLLQIRNWEANNQATLAPHATYSVSSDLLLLIKAHLQADGGITTLHHLENEDEVQFFQDGSGPIRRRLDAFGIPEVHLPRTGIRPLAALTGYLPEENKMLLVHNTVTKEQDLLLTDRLFPNAWWCFCPNSNLFIENALPDFHLFAGHDHRLTLGTDGYASNASLSILEEMKTIQQAYPKIELEKMIRWGTLNGAEFLGIDSWAGSFDKGKIPGINLIEFADTERLRLLPGSRVRVITRHLPS